MKGFENMICPICKEDTITIEEERVGPTGYRETEYTIIAKANSKSGLLIIRFKLRNFISYFPFLFF